MVILSGENMKYKIGDKVKIRKDLVENELYGGMDFIDEMSHCSGKVLTIYGIDDGKWYLMIEDGDSFCWSDEMIECKIEDTDSIFKCSYDRNALNFWLNCGVIIDKNEKEIKGAIVKTGKILYGTEAFKYILVNDECIYFEIEEEFYI